MRIKSNQCVGCAECIHCGRKDREYTTLVCDLCNDEVDTLYKDFNGEELCEECAIEKWKRAFLSEYFKEVKLDEEYDCW